MSVLKCWNCGRDLSDVPLPISRHEQCQACFEPLHCCRLCRHYRPGASIECDEDRADPPITKEIANFCDWFRPSAGAFSERRADRSSQAQSQLEALFGQDDDQSDQQGQAATDPPPSAEEEARSKLDDLFSKD